MPYTKELSTCKLIARQAGMKILEIYQNVYQIAYKEDESPVTTADIEANDIIVQGLLASFPDIPILSEESIEDERRYDHEWTFIVDPLDGTKEFIKHNDEFTVNIALARYGKIVMGVIYAPAFDEMYYGVRGEGAYMELGDGSIKRIHVSERTEGLHILKSRSHHISSYNQMMAKQQEKIATVTKLGSSIKGCRIASGQYDVYYNFGNTMIWDTAAMEIIVKEAGGVFAQLDGSPIDYRAKDVRNVKGFYILNKITNALK